MCTRIARMKSKWKQSNVNKTVGHIRCVVVIRRIVRFFFSSDFIFLNMDIFHTRER